MANSSLKLGVDLGGSKILGAVVRKGRVVATEKRATKAEEGYESVVKRIVRVVDEVCEEAGVSRRDFDCLGVGVPGPVSDGVLLHAPNLDWKRPALAQDLARLTGIGRVELANDVNCGALGEATVGAGAGHASVYALFVGTGLGGGWVTRGAVHEGAHGFAGEVGHMQVPGHSAPCACGQLGCLETIASKQGIRRLLKKAVAAGTACAIEDLQKLKSRDIERAYREGCPATTGAIETVAESLGWAMNLISCVVNPSVFVLGGGVAERLGQELLPTVARVREQAAFVAHGAPLEVVVGSLGGAAVAVGAAQLGGAG